MRARRIISAVCGAVLLVSCGADSGTVDTAVARGDGAVTLVGGGTIDPVALSAERPVALWFWAPG